MKNFKKVVFGLLAMLVMVTGVRASVYDDDITGVGALGTCLTSPDDSVYCKLIQHHSYNYDITVTGKDVTLVIADGEYLAMQSTKKIIVADGAKLTIRTEGTGELRLATPIDVQTGGSLVVEGKVTQKVANQGLISVTGDTAAASEDPRAPHTVKTTSVVVDSSAVMTNTLAAGWGLSVGGYAQVTLNGDWLTTGETLRFNAGSNAAVDINGGKYVSNYGTALLLASTTSADVVVNDGTFKSTAKTTVDVEGGSLTVNRAVVDATNDGKGTQKAVLVNNASLIINDGTFTADQNQSLYIYGKSVSEINGGSFASALNITTFNSAITASDDAKTTIYGGEYTGNAYTLTKVKAVLGEGLSAARIGDTVYVGKEHKLDIEVVEENGKKIELRTPQTLLGGHTYTLKYLEDNRYLLVEANEGYVAKYVLVVGDEQTLVKDGEFTMPDSDAKLVVTFVTPDELNQEMNNPTNGGENDGEKGDENTNTNPGTFDGIATIVTMAVSSLSAAGYSIKKIVRK